MNILRKTASENDANINIDTLNTIKKLLIQVSDELEMLEYSVDKMQADYGENLDEVKNAIKELKNISFHVSDSSGKMDKEVYSTLNKWLNDIVVKNQKG